MLNFLRDYREPRDWKRIWRDPAGFLLPSCVCCPSSPSSSNPNITIPCCSNTFPPTLTVTFSENDGICTGWNGQSMKITYSATASEADSWATGVCYNTGHPFVGGWAGTATICGTVVSVGLWCETGSPFVCANKVFSTCVNVAGGGNCTIAGTTQICPAIGSNSNTCSPISLHSTNFTFRGAGCTCCGGGTNVGIVRYVITI